MSRFAKSPEDIAPQEVLLSMPGLEFLRGMIDGRLPQPAMAGSLGFRLVEASEGRAVFRGAAGFAFTNPMGSVHGGWYGSLLDSALGCAVMSVVPQGFWYTTLEYKVNLTRALPLDTEVECVGTVRHAGRSTAVAEADVRIPGDPRVFATGSTTCLIMRG
ncbi:MAG: PaaI family thioesterase [Gemmobacter sp.]